jgi:hypothetical protein
MLHPPRLRAPRWPLLALAALALALLPARPAWAAGGPGGPENSLALIPADAAFYSTGLRYREQLDRFLKSKAFASLRDMQGVKLGMALLQQQWDDPTGNLKPVRDFFEQAENQELLALLGDAFANEIFFYGGQTWGDSMELMMQVQGASRYGPALLKATGKTRGLDDSKLQGLVVLNVLNQNLDLIKVPDLILGFRLGDTKRAENQIKRLQTLLGQLEEQAPPLKGRVKRTKVGDSNYLTLNLDGEMVPWDQVNLKEFEEKPGEFDKLLKKLRGLKLTVSLGVQEKYLLLGFGPSAEHLAVLGAKGKKLIDRPELKPLAKFTGKKLTSVGYASKDFRAKAGTNKKDLDGLADMAKGFLPEAGLPEAKRKQIEKDLDGLVGDLKKFVPDLGSELSFSFLTDAGYESYSYSHGTFNELDSSKPLTLLEHVGGDPIFALAGRSKNSGQAYAFMTKWVKVAFGHGEDIFVEKLGKEDKEKYQEARKALLPLVAKLDEITGQMLLPALADEQTALVIDAKWGSKQWHKAMPMADKPLPMLEVGLALGVSDADLLRKAMGEYRTTANDMIAAVRKLVPKDANFPDFSIPEPKTHKAAAGALYYFPLPEEWGVDKQVAPTMGLSDKVAVLAPSRAMAERLLTRKKLVLPPGSPLADAKRPLTGAFYCNWPGLIDALTPWVDFGLEMAPFPGGVGVDKESVSKQVHTVLEVLKCYRGTTSATYLEGGVLVTHGQSVFQDLK